MIEKFYYENNINKYMTMQEFEGLDIITIPKGKEIYLENLYFIIDGKVELFIINQDEETMKIKNIDNKQFAIGIISNLDYQGATLFYKTITKVTLVKIDQNTLCRLQENFEFIKWCNELLFYNLMEISKNLLIRSVYSSTEILEYLFKNEVDENDEVYIENFMEFVEKYKISRSVFYNGIKELEKSKKIKKTGKKIKILK